MPASYVDVRGANHAAKLINELGDRARRPQRFLTGASEVLREGFRKQFDSHGGYYGGGWQALAASTLRRKAQQGYTSEPMVQTGGLRSRVMRARARIGAGGVLVGLGRDPVAMFHQGGTGDMPRRQLIGLTAREPAAIRALGQAWIMGRFTGL